MYKNIISLTLILNTVFYLFMHSLWMQDDFFSRQAQLGNILKIKKLFLVVGAQLDNPLINDLIILLLN